MTSLMRWFGFGSPTKDLALTGGSNGPKSETLCMSTTAHNRPRSRARRGSCSPANPDGVKLAAAHEQSGSCFIQVQEGLHLALCDIAEAQVHFEDQAPSTRFAWICTERAPRSRKSRWEPEPPPLTFRPCKLGDIARFSAEVNKFRRSNPLETLVICASRRADAVAYTTFLVASYMLLFQRSTLDQALSFLRPPSPEMKAAVHALHHAKSLSWIDLPADLSSAVTPSTASPIEDRIFLDEYLYYDNPINGDMHVLVPGRFLAFTRPVDIPSVTIPGQRNRRPQWTDDGERRRFGADYFLDMFEDFRVNLVLRCTPALYDATAFTNSGIYIEELTGSGNSCQNLLRDMDRFMTLEQLSRGYIALECGEEGLGPSQVLVTAFLVRRFGFSGEAAEAWLRIMHPGHGTGDQADSRLQLKLLERAPASSAPRSGRRRSSSASPLARTPSSDILPVSALQCTLALPLERCRSCPDLCLLTGSGPCADA